MRIKYSYNLFPGSLQILGYIFIIMAMYGFYITLSSSMNDNSYKDAGYALAFLLIGLILITFKSTILIDKDSESVYKSSHMLGLILSREKVRIPKNCKGLIVKQKTKFGRGYYNAAISMSYRLKSFDISFYSDRGFVRLIHTDEKRALKIASLIKDSLGIAYKFE